MKTAAQIQAEQEAAAKAAADKAIKDAADAAAAATAEATRVEAARVAEVARVAQETTRAAEEVTRREAETKRVAAEAERTRVNEIMAAVAKAGLPMEFAQNLIADGTAIDAARSLILDKLGEISTRTAINGAQDTSMRGRFDPVSGRVMHEANEGDAEAMAEALAIRILQSRRDCPGIVTPEQKEWCERNARTDLVRRACRVYDGHERPVNERVTQFLGVSIVEMAARHIGWKKAILPSNATEVLGRACDRTRMFHSTGDFPAILESALHKVLLARYTLAMPTYRAIAVQRNFNDFRPHNMIRAGEFPMLEEITETGEIKAGTTADSKETVSVKPYGRQYGLSRQLMVNDDIGGMDQILSSISDVVVIHENVVFWAMFNSNPVLVQDSTAVFDVATHKNLASPGGNPSVLTISDGRKAIRKQKTISGNLINYAPRYIVAGPEQETKVDQILTTITPALNTSVNPFSGKLAPLNDALITGQEWYMMCDPSQIPCFVYGFLSGGYSPRIRTDEPFGYQGMRFSVEADFGCGAIDYRGFYKNEGVGPSGAGY